VASAYCKLLFHDRFVLILQINVLMVGSDLVRPSALQIVKKAYDHVNYEFLFRLK
jgi:hypothetical protein